MACRTVIFMVLSFIFPLYVYGSQPDNSRSTSPVLAQVASVPDSTRSHVSLATDAAGSVGYKDKVHRGINPEKLKHLASSGNLRSESSGGKEPCEDERKFDFSESLELEMPHIFFALLDILNLDRHQSVKQITPTDSILTPCKIIGLWYSHYIKEVKDLLRDPNQHDLTVERIRRYADSKHSHRHEIYSTFGIHENPALSSSTAPAPAASAATSQGGNE